MLVAGAGYGHIGEVLLALFGGAEDLEEGGDGGVVVVPREVILRGTSLRRLHLTHLQEIGSYPGSAIVALGQTIVALGHTIVALGQQAILYSVKIKKPGHKAEKARAQVSILHYN